MIFKDQIMIDLMRVYFARKNENIGDPITNTHWVDSWSHDEKTTDQVGQLVADYGPQLKTKLSKT